MAFSVPVARTCVRILLVDGAAGVGAVAVCFCAISAAFTVSGVVLFAASGIVVLGWRTVMVDFGASFFAGSFAARGAAFLSLSFSFSLTAAGFVGALRTVGFVSAGAIVFVSSVAGFFAGRPRFLTAGGVGGVDIAGGTIDRQSVGILQLLALGGERAGKGCVLTPEE